MQLDAFFDPSTQLSAIPELAREAEALGFGGIWLAETQHNPFLAATLIAEHTQSIQIGSAIAVSFARSPAVMAQAAFDLAELSGGRFHLGLGTQVRGHIERRFGMQWPDSPVGKLREQIEALRAFWALWQEGQTLNLRGDYYKLTLSSAFFEPQSITQPQIPIWIAGVNRGLAKLAGAAADGFLVHPYHSVEHLEATILPAIRTGAEKAGREQGPQIMVNAFVVSSQAEREFVQQQLSFYASTPSYASVMQRHGWAETAQQLGALAARKQWAAMAELITDEMLEAFAVVAPEGELAEALRARYGAFADRITLYSPFVPGQRDDFWRSLVADFDTV